MKTDKGTQKTAKGSYLNLKSWDFTQVEANDDVLPGEMTAAYVKVPTPVAAVAGPLIGMVFLIFLPFMGIVGFLGFIAFRIYAGFRALGRTMAQGVVYRRQPGRAPPRGSRPRCPVEASAPPRRG